jgi:hypothetical protein
MSIAGALREGLPPLPKAMQRLPLDHRGFPVPWFVHWANGQPDFRVIRRGGREMAISKNWCWVCGMLKGVYHTFVIGPMCAINRVTMEPPCHLECAQFAVRACPFLLQPRMRRNEKDLPEEIQAPPGVHLEHNPGAMCLWTTKSFKPFRVDRSFLIKLGEPTSISWWANGTAATPNQIRAAIDKGLLELTRNAEAEGPESVIELNRAIARFAPLLKSAFSVNA